MGGVAAVTLLATQRLSRRFGGLDAVSEVDFSLEPGEIRAVIGPNGAGKTTLVNMICGKVAPTSGRIVFDGEDITRLSPWKRVERGIAYTFQITSVFANLTCFDNVALAAQRARTWSRNGGSRNGGSRSGRSGGGDLSRDVMDALGRVGLEARAGMRASDLPYGHQRLLEVALGLALRPRLLILDEPTQGLSEEEIAGFCALVRDLAREATILLIEHNMQVVMELADRITVMDNGRVLAEGAPAGIQADPLVRKAYLGT
jgi:branched-chain amino acid transport system ATP-binding protein